LSSGELWAFVGELLLFLALIPVVSFLAHAGWELWHIVLEMLLHKLRTIKDVRAAISDNKDK